MTESKTDNNYSHVSENEDQTLQETPKKKQVVGGWWLAGSYFIGWLIILVIFKLVYNRYRQRSKSSRKKWFPSHPEKEAYEALLADDSVTEEALRKALLKRAMTDVKRVWQLQEEKDSLYKLMRAGSVPESLWANYKDADQDMQLEIYDLQAEAETFKPGWSQAILREAAQLVQRERELTALKARIEMEERATQADANKTAKEKAADREKLAKAHKVAMQMINKQYGGSGLFSPDADEKEVDQKEVDESGSEEEGGEK